MKDGINGLLVTIAICGAIIAVVFGLLGELIGLDFAISIAYFAGAALVLSIFTLVVIWVFSFDWTEAPFIKLTCTGVLLAILSYIIYTFFEWELFYTIFVICAVIVAVTIVIGIIKTIFDI